MYYMQDVIADIGTGSSHVYALKGLLRGSLPADRAWVELLPKIVPQPGGIMHRSYSNEWAQYFLGIGRSAQQ